MKDHRGLLCKYAVTSTTTGCSSIVKNKMK